MSVLLRTRFEHPFSLVDQSLFQLQVDVEFHFVPRRLGRAREFCREVQQVALERTIGKNEREFLARESFMPIFGHKIRRSRTRLPFSHCSIPQMGISFGTPM